MCLFLALVCDFSHSLHLSMASIFHKITIDPHICMNLFYIIALAIFCFLIAMCIFLKGAAQYELKP